MKRNIIIVSAFILLFALFTASEGKTGGTISIKDASGQSIRVKLPVKRIVILNSDALEVIWALGAKDRVVGICNGIRNEQLFGQGLKGRAVVGSWSEPNYELIVELNPDIVICYGRWPGRQLEKKLTLFGIKVVRLDFYKMGSLLKEIEILGKILEKEDKTRQLVNWYRKKLKLIESKLNRLKNPPEVYVESYTKYISVGPTSGAHEMCVLAGGYNIASDSSIPYPEVTPEWVLAKDPHLVVKVSAFANCYSMTEPGALKSIRNEIMNRPAWDNIQAVQDGKVYMIACDIWTGPRAIIGISYMAKWFHPDLFNDLDPEKLHREYLEKFQGIKYQGVYVYP